MSEDRTNTNIPLDLTHLGGRETMDGNGSSAGGGSERTLYLSG